MTDTLVEMNRIFAAAGESDQLATLIENQHCEHGGKDRR